MLRLDEERGSVIDWDFLYSHTVGFDDDHMPADAKLAENVRGYVEGAYDAIIAVRRAYPRVVFHLHAGSSLTLLDRLNAGQLDFMLEVEHIARPGYEGLVFPGADVWGVYPLPDTPLAGKTSVRPEDLVGEPLIVSRQFLKSGFLKQWAGECYASIKPAVSTDIFPSHWRRLVEGRVGHMLGYLYFQNEEDSVLGSHGIPFDPPLETGNALIWKKGRPPVAGVAGVP